MSGIETVVHENDSLLGELGFSEFFSAQWHELLAAGFSQDAMPARVSSFERGIAHLVGSSVALGELSGALRARLDGLAIATGDWVLVTPTASANEDGARGSIIHLFSRRTQLNRRSAGSEFALQVLLANVDIVFVVTSANRDFNPRRLERYLTAAWDSGAQPVVVLNKIDLTEEVDAYIERIKEVAIAAPIVAISAQQGTGLDVLLAHVKPGQTIALIGSSGVGKSSLVNRLMQDATLAVAATDSYGRGRHTTTRRSLCLLAKGGVLIDTPGMRELGLLDAEAGLSVAFSDVTQLAQECRFRDCQHQGEPGCAVGAAVAVDQLSAERLSSFHKLERELFAARLKHEPRLLSEERKQRRSKVKNSRERAKLRARTRLI